MRASFPTAGSGRERLAPWVLTGTTIAVGAIVTLAIGVLPFARFAYRRPSAHVALDTLAAFVALLAAYLVFGRFRESRRIGDVVLVAALATFGFTNLFLSAVPEIVSDSTREFSAWASLGARLLGAGALAISAFLPDGHLRTRSRTSTAILAGSLAGVLLVAVGAAAVSELPPVIEQMGSVRPSIVVHPVVITIQLLNIALFAAAAWGFTARATRTGDELERWLGAAASLGAFARVNYLLFPSLYSDYVYTGDVLRLGFYLLLLYGAGREIRAYWRGLAQTAVFEERRRIARDLHDGLAHELNYILSQTRQSTRGTAINGVAVAAERALDESRRAIAALTMPMGQSLDEAIAHCANEIAPRWGLRVRYELQEDVHVPPKTQEEMLRVVREAITNAGRHGCASVLTIGLTSGDELRMWIEDDGSGFDIEEEVKGGFGLTSMRERVKALGGQLRVLSDPNHGTTIEAILRG